MRTTYPFGENQVFDAATAQAMAAAFDNAWEQLARDIDISTYAEPTREALATYIIQLARRGERDPERLRAQAVTFVLQATQRKQA